MFTAVNRKIDDPLLNWLPDKAYTGGIDPVHKLKDRKFYVSGKAFIMCNGSETAMIEKQRSSERYFQRPDNDHAHVDSTRRSLTGTGGTIILGKREENLSLIPVIAGCHRNWS